MTPPRAKERALRVIRYVDEHLEELFLILFLLIITLATGVQVVMRYVFNNSLSWTEEVSRYSLVASGFFSIGYCIRKKLALRIDMAVNLLPMWIRLALGIGCSLFLIWLYARFFMGSFPVMDKMNVTNATTPALDIPLLYIYTLPVIGFGLAILRLVQSMLMDVREWMKRPYPAGEGG